MVIPPEVQEGRVAAFARGVDRALRELDSLRRY
jgi:hypothetical protein